MGVHAADARHTNGADLNANPKQPYDDPESVSARWAAYRPRAEPRDGRRDTRELDPAQEGASSALCQVMGASDGWRRGRHDRSDRHRAPRRPQDPSAIRLLPSPWAQPGGRDTRAEYQLFRVR